MKSSPSCQGIRSQHLHHQSPTLPLKFTRAQCRHQSSCLAIARGDGSELGGNSNSNDDGEADEDEESGDEEEGESRSRFTHRHFQLVPCEGGETTIQIDGVKMHITASKLPSEDARDKVKLARVSAA